MANFNLDVTLKQAVDDFAQKDPVELAWKTGTEFKNSCFYLDFLGETVEVTYPAGEIKQLNTGRELDLIERILILHYFIQGEGTPILNKDISFKELPGGGIYIEPFTNRCIRPLVGIFGQQLDLFQMVAEKLQGLRQKHGDISYRFYPLPRIPVTLVLWAADEEFPANGNILFDASAGDYLKTEDYAFLCGMLVGKLKNMLKKD